MGEERGVYRVLVGKPEGKRPLGRPRCRWVDNIRKDIQEWDVGIWVGLGWPRIGQVAGACECGYETSGSVKCGEFFD